MDLGRQRSDLWENCIFEESIYANRNELCFFQAIHQEADVVVENIDAIRAMMGGEKGCGQISCCNERSPQFQNHSE